MHRFLRLSRNTSLRSLRPAPSTYASHPLTPSHRYNSNTPRPVFTRFKHTVRPTGSGTNNMSERMREGKLKGGPAFSTTSTRDAQFTDLTPSSAPSPPITSSPLSSSSTPSTTPPRNTNPTTSSIMPHGPPPSSATPLTGGDESTPSITEITESETTYGNFDLVRKIRLDFTDVVVSKWKSRVTGLEVVHLDYEAPIVNGYFVVRTEIFNDSGCPHTLEHLVFMGSKQYPYKGIIDHLANRCFSPGTNAWTATDHTAYTLSTAGPTGFLNLLPIYIDHILFPTMTKEGFVTEVHHVDGRGEDGGVVYSEMQGRESGSGDLMNVRMGRLMYPEGSAYRSETGGLMEALRVLSVEQIREYHAEYYTPENLSLIVTGKLTNGTPDLLHVLQTQVEPTLIPSPDSSSPTPPHTRKAFKRPFLESPTAQLNPPIAATTKSTVHFPESDESQGELILAYKGPSPSSFLERKALDVLGTYLTSGPVAPLNKAFVEIAEPLCTYLYFGEDARVGRVEIPVYVGGVPVGELEGFDERLVGEMRKVVREGIDMERMAMVLKRDERQLRSKLESSKGDTFSDTVISDFLYGPTDGTHLGPSMDEFTYYTTLSTWSSSQWTSLLSKFYVDAPYINIIGRPSASLAVELKENEEKRVKEQRERIGEEGLRECERAVEEAKKEHEREIPREVLERVKVPDVGSIQWIKVDSVLEQGKGRKASVRAVEVVPKVDEKTKSEVEKYVSSDGEELDFFVQYDHVQSDFVTVHAFFSLADLPNHLRPFIPLYLGSFFSLPVQRLSSPSSQSPGSGSSTTPTPTYLTHTQLINALDNETVSYEIELGAGGYFTEMVRVSVKVEVGAYEKAVEWIRDLVWGSVLHIPSKTNGGAGVVATPSTSATTGTVAEDNTPLTTPPSPLPRLQITLAKLAQSIPELKRDGSTVLSSLHTELLYDEEKSTGRAVGLLGQMDSVPDLVKMGEEDGEGLVRGVREVREALTKASGIRFAVTGNVLGVKEPRSTWRKYMAPQIAPTPLAPVPLTLDTLSAVGVKPAKQALLTSLPSIESSFTTHTTTSFTGFQHPDYPAMRVALEVLNATESFLWRYIRGSGLAYGAYVGNDVESGLLSFSLYRSSNCLQAFDQAKKVIEGLVDGSIPIEDTTLVAAKSSIVYGVAKSVSTSGRAAFASLTNTLKSLPPSHHLTLLPSFQAITTPDVLRVLETYFIPLFDAERSVAVVVSSEGKIGEVERGLGERGFACERREVRGVDGEEGEGDSEGESEGDSDSDESMR